MLPFSRADYHRWLTLTALILMCALPPLVPNHVPPMPTFYEEWFAAVFGMALVGLVAMKSLRGAFHVPYSVIPLIGLIGVLIVQYVLGKYAYAQQLQWGILYLLFAILLIWAGVALREMFGLRRVVTAIAIAIACSGLLSSFIVIAQVYGIPETMKVGIIMYYNPETRPYGNFGQSNLFVDYAALALASLVFLTASDTIRSRVSVAVAVPILVSIALAGSRNAFIYTALIALSATITNRGTRLPSLKRAATLGWMLVLGLALVDVGLRLTGLGVQGSALYRLGTLFSETHNDGLSMRLNGWRIALDIFLANPLLGAGFGSYGWEYLSRSLDHPNNSVHAYMGYAHNAVMQLMADTGLLGTLCGVLPLIVWAWRRLRAGPSLEHAWMLAVVSVIVLHSLVEYPIWYASFLALLAIVIGLGETRSFTVERAGIGAIGIGAVVISSGLFLANLHRDFVDLRTWVYAPNYAQLEVLGGEARMREIVSRLRSRILQPQTELRLCLQVDVSPVDLEEKLELNAKQLRFAPNAGLRMQRIVLLTLAKRSDEARWYLDRTVRTFPEYMPEFRRSISSFASTPAGQSGGFERLVRDLDAQMAAANIPMLKTAAPR